MNNDQQIVSWVAVFAILVGVYLVYGNQLKAIMFGGGTPNPPGSLGGNPTSTGAPSNPFQGAPIPSSTTPGLPESGLLGTLSSGGTLLNPSPYQGNTGLNQGTSTSGYPQNPFTGEPSQT